ncbi:ATP-binding protein [Paraburkholderia sp. JPY303]|uniref:AAA family ATPase n=1 Tax=Paraburkholderia atlantica TaxID=2654982 RepID=UPI0015915267|nr:ATP-binding protein [Paraburkholderia atlantica]NUY35959.1 ATP-binding protein [Paraburkholderia atlantica]
MFRIESVRSPRCELHFGRRKQGDNHVSVITGPNGSGKTEILTTLANWFRNQGHRRHSSNTSVSWVSGGASNFGVPSRVIAQTFSPFSRFAAPRNVNLTLLDIYADDARDTGIYRSVGINRMTRGMSSTLSKRTLERGIFQLTESPEHARTLGHVLYELGFLDRITLSYRQNALGLEAYNAYSSGLLGDFVSRATSRPRIKSPLMREVEREGLADVTRLLESAFDLLREHMRQSIFEFTFDFAHARASEDFAVLQALTLLRRLNLLHLESCKVTSIHSGKPLDLADASSGQQQMLCSLVGLLSELRDDSLVLIDEPELSLHPTWQMTFLDRLKVLLRQVRGCHIILATHSPLIVQSALRANLEVLQLYDDFEGAPADVSRQYGERASVESTLLDVFGTPVTDSVYLSNEVFDIVTGAESGGATSRNAARARLRKLQTLYSRQETRANPGDLNIIEKALQLVSAADDEEAIPDVK